MKSYSKNWPGDAVSMNEPEAPLSWQPPVDIYRTRQGWLLKVELAGVRPQDVGVELRGNQVIIRGRRADTTLTEVRDEGLAEGLECHAMEIAYSHFERAVRLPGEIGPTQVHAQFRAGMLLLALETSQDSNG